MMHSHNFATIITRKIMRVNNFASFCELDRALTPVAPCVGLARRCPLPRSARCPPRSASALTARRRHVGVQAPLRARCGLHRLHRYVPRAIAHRRRTPLRRRLLAVRYCDPVRGHKEKAGLVLAFSFAMVHRDELRSRHASRATRQIILLSAKVCGNWEASLWENRLVEATDCPHGRGGKHGKNA